MKVKMRKASITVEAVLVVPLVLMVIFLLLSLTFFVHARSWYTFAAYESTMLAASEGRLSVEKERQPPKAGWNGGFPRYRFRLNR